MDEGGDQKGPESLKLDLNVDCEVESRVEEDEDEDVDFNPFVGEACSPEASSSLSSEIEERDIEGDTTEYETGCLCSEAEERVPRGLGVGGERVSEYEENLALVSQAEIENLRDGETGLASGTDVAEYETVEELGTREDARNPVFDEDDDVDAICKRTRARYSLASFTLDELETFLQETDDEDDLPNSDDEEVYRKFLAAVLLGGDVDGKVDHENQVVDDEDEDNDADFELEIEEALESDTDERIHEKEKDEARRRPETRQNRHKRTPPPVKDSGHLQSLRRPLRPLVPLPPLPSAPLSLSTAMDKTITPTCLSSSAENLVKSGFTPHQLGQLHCIIYEHIQLLVQVFSLSVFDPARHHIASQVQGLLMDLIDKRNQALARKKDHHPVFCFSPPYLHPSVPCELPQTWPIQFPSVQTPSLDSFGQVPAPDLNIVLFTEERLRNEGREDTSKQKEMLLWLPLISGPLYSVLDVAPLSLVEKYMHDVKIAVKDYQQRFLRDTCDTHFECESMFPSFLDPNIGCADTATGKVSSCSEGSSSLPSRKSPKKPLVAELIENSKKQPVALVPRLLSKLALRFVAFFNPALYPRKPPPIIIANRFLFTTAEDELLALGMMEYNTDWKAIQQRFLPCKSKHQIFVRQKNCCTSKAPENPIKAVRRMKTSPLTMDEVARIREGLKIFKLDWFSIWKFIVPYRDPSLLARQWRIALGTQKSYKSDSANKERRRLYEANRRQTKAESRNLSEKRDKNNSSHDSIENEDVAFVHEAFLADWRPLADASVSSHVQTNQPSTSLPANYQANIQSGPDQPKVSYYTPGAINSSKSTFCSRPYRARRSRNAQMVKLAPGLPALNLPPSVRVMSQSAFKNYHPVASAKVSTSCSGGVPNVTPIRLSFTASGASMSNMGLSNLNSSTGKSVTNSREDSSGAYLEMHPLLFQSSGDGSGLPYHPLKFTSGTSSSFTFFNANQSQASGSLFRKEQDGTTGYLYSDLQADGTTSVSCGIDFHPLLRRADDAECSARNALSSVQANLSLELLNEVGAGNISNLHEKANQLNLEIQLSSSPRERQLRKSTEATDNIESRITSKETMNPSTSPNGSNSLPFFLGSNTNARTYRLDLAGEQSLDIVMEQEELSDSDEEDNEIEEDIEFEREEMTDSEPDAASDFESALQTQNKEVNSGRKTLTVPGHRSEENGLIDGSRFHPCLTLNLARQDNDLQKRGKDQRPGKKRTPIRKRGRGAANGPPSVPLTLGSLLEVHPKKPRKRICKSKLRLDTSAAECSGSVNN